MSEDSNRGGWRITTSREQIREWAEGHGAEPVRVKKSDGDYELQLLASREDVQGEQISWDQFFDRLEAEWLAFRYRETAAGGQSAYEFVDREALTTAEPIDGSPPDFDQATTHQNAWSDTGEDEPTPAETETNADTEGSGERAARSNKHVSGTRVSQEDTAMSESSHGAERGAFVLDEIHEERGLTDDVEDEYLKFENTGEERLDLSGWVVGNEDGQTYVFPDGFVLDAGEHVTLHSGDDTDSETDLYWGAAKPVWDDDGDTVTVTTANGQQVLREPYNE